MLESKLDIIKGEGHIILCPNMSASWRTTRRLLWLVSMIALAIASMFAVTGLWLILPFAGLEIITLVSLMYWVAIQCCRKQVITLANNRILVEKGYHTPNMSWESELFWTRLVVQQAPYRGHPSRLFLCSKQETLEIGEFLDENEKKNLVAEIRQVVTVKP